MSKRLIGGCGDEFLIISLFSDGGEVEAFAQKIIGHFSKPLKILEEETYIKFSIGISKFPEDGQTANSILRNTDLAMYVVKKGGKNNFIRYNQSMLQEIMDKSDIEKTVRAALDHNGFELVYQAQVSTTDKAVVGYEALIRMKSRKYRPDQFIEIAENNGQIIEIGRWVLLEVIRQQSELIHKHGIRIPISINFSAKQLNDLGFKAYLENALEKYNVPGHLLEIEITESILLEEDDDVLTYLNDIKSLGLKMSLDDFGTGYSSISYLSFLPIDKLKLDKSIIERFIDQENVDVLQNIIDLAHNFSFDVVAEGVESRVQYEILKKMKCDCIQGYYFSKPISSILDTKILH